MTHNRPRQNEELVFTAKNPHFFKIILDDAIRDGKLMIPRKLVRKYGSSLSSTVHIKVPTGAEWVMELSKCDGEIWFQSGWKEFAEYYSVRTGHLLVFRYEGNSRFDVLIFDMSAVEIEYPCTNAHGDESNIGGEFQETKMAESETDVSVEIIDDFPPSQKTRQKSLLSNPRPQKRTRTNSTKIIDSTSTLQSSVPRFSSSSCQHGVKLESCKKSTNSGPSAPKVEEIGGDKFSGLRHPETVVRRRTRPLTIEEKAKAFERASGFKSKNPFFMVAMQPSYIHPAHEVSVPRWFAREYFTEKRGDIVLHVSDGTSWSATYGCGTNYGRPRGRILAGWREFVQDNCLQVGDVCVFELIKGTKISFKVVIFRNL